MILSLGHAVRAENPSSTPATAGGSQLSPAQSALFDTPHLSNVTSPETLRYAYRQVGADEFSDTILVHVKEINADGTKNLSFDYLTGSHRIAYPTIADFHGNPLLMLVLDQDVDDMNKAVGLSQAYLRNRIREAFLNAPITATTANAAGQPLPARLIKIKPFAGLERLERIPSLQNKTYSFTLSESLPGMIASIAIETPSDPALNAAAFAKTITFEGVSP